jgi:hypothetical protein
VSQVASSVVRLLHRLRAYELAASFQIPAEQLVGGHTGESVLPRAQAQELANAAGAALQQLAGELAAGAATVAPPDCLGAAQLHEGECSIGSLVSMQPMLAAVPYVLGFAR